MRTALPMRFVNADGDPVESDLLEVTSADVVLRTITVEQDLYPTRTVSLSSEGLTEGKPADGYRVAGVTVTPSTVVVAGPQSTLDLLEDLSISDPVDITGPYRNLLRRGRAAMARRFGLSQRRHRDPDCGNRAGDGIAYL